MTYIDRITVMIRAGCRLTTTLTCLMDLRNYPLDLQTCNMDIESCKTYFDCLMPLISVFSQTFVIHSICI